MHGNALLAALCFAAVGLTGCGGGKAPPPSGLAPGDGGTGSTRTVAADDHRFVETVQEMLRGQVAGLEVIDDPQCGGIVLRIRQSAPSLLGAACDPPPLLIIDGKPIGSGGVGAALRGLLPYDIDNIQVLKDVASTSIYGSRGAYGVVIISTRH